MTTHKDRPLFWFIDHGPADGVEFFDHSDEVVAMKRGATPLYASPVTPAAQAVAVPDGILAAVSEIEDAIAQNKMTAAMVFTKMRAIISAAQRNEDKS